MPEQNVLDQLEQRLGRVYVRQRLGIEQDFEDEFAHGINFSHPDKWYSIPSAIRKVLILSGLYGRGRKNATRVQVLHNDVSIQRLPPLFEGFTILHISDLHVDLSLGAMERLIELLDTLKYDICVLTGDFRGAVFGPFDVAMQGLARVRCRLNELVYAVLGNHDSIRMVPEMEEMGIRVLLNEAETLERGDQRIHLAGVDDAHDFRMDNLEKAASEIPREECSILLSHSPEIYRQAAHAGFNLCLSGHTHGGQICLPGAIPISLSCILPRRMGSGPWSYAHMAGYTSVGVGSCMVSARFNCPPEITLHRLRQA